MKVVFDWEYEHSKTEEFKKILSFEKNLPNYIAKLEN
jgi:hypothetical protein